MCSLGGALGMAQVISKKRVCRCRGEMACAEMWKTSGKSFADFWPALIWGRPHWRMADD